MTTNSGTTTNLRRATLLLLGAVASATLGGCIGNVEVASWPLHASYQRTDYQELHLEAGSLGTVEVHGCGCSVASADVFVRSLLARDSEGAIMERSSLGFFVDGSSLRLQLDLGGRPADAETIQVNGLMLQLPSATPLRLEGGSGTLVVDGMTGPVEASVTTGDVVVGTSGSATVETVSGNQDIRCDGPIDATAVSGDVRAQGPSGRVEATSGNIDFVWSAPPGQTLRLTTTSGDVRVSVLPGRGYTYQIDATSGDVQLPVAPGSRDNQQSGKVGDGAAHLFISATSGNVQIN